MDAIVTPAKRISRINIKAKKTYCKHSKKNNTEFSGLVGLGLLGFRICQLCGKKSTPVSLLKPKT